MTSYPPAVPRSHAIHHPRTPRNPNLEKGHLVDPAGPSMSRGAGYRENPAETNDRQRQLTNMCLTGLGTSPRQYHPCTRPLGPPPLYRPRTTRQALHSPWIAYPGLQSSPRLLHTTLRHVRRFFRSVRSHAAFQSGNDPQRRG